jgi:mono/diheme cytochrome c family protein
MSWFGIVLALLVVLIAGLVLYVLIAWNRPTERAVVEITVPRDPSTMARGKALYEDSMLCWGCHGTKGLSPSEPQSGGRAFDLRNVGPGFGVLYASNVTPDRETGLGTWSDGEILRAIREGLSRDGRTLFPVMPYQFYHGLGEDDGVALVAYLRSLAPVHNVVPRAQPSFMRKALTAFRLIAPEAPVPKGTQAPPKARTVEYGRYVAWHRSGCAECHTPRSPDNGQLDTSRPMAGGLFAFEELGMKITAPNITADPATGIGGWTEEQFLTAARRGMRPDGRILLPFMPWPWYSRWDDDDLRAVWLYLRSLPAVSHAVPGLTFESPALKASGAARGEALFKAYCESCHGENGASGPLTTLSLKDIARVSDEAALASYIAEGIPGTLMPSFATTLTDDQRADIVAFLRAGAAGP